MRQLRFSRAPVLLALPRVRRVGNVFAAPRRRERASGMNDPRVIVALDFAQAEKSLAFAARVKPQSCRLKVGKELFTAAGPPLLAIMRQRHFGSLPALTFHGSPHTAAGTCTEARQVGVWLA